MASPPSRLSDKKYINWLKSTLYLLYLKGGVEGIVDNEAKRFHEDLQKALGVYGSAPQCCFVCTPTCIKQDNKQHKWRMSCPLCDLWLNQIMLNHLKKPLPKLSRENTNPQLWPTSEFEVCKLYMPYGCQQNQSAKDADIQSILKLFENCLHFTNCGRIGRMDLVNKLLEIRNTRVHSGDFKVDDADLQVDMQTTLDFLQGLTNLSASERQAVQEALDQITKLHAGILDLSLNKELELHALQMKQNALETEVNHLVNTLVEHRERIRTLEEDVKTIQTSTVKCSEIDAKASATDLQMLAARTESIEQRIQKLHEANVLFKKFLQENNLEEDITRLSASIQQHGQIIQEHGRELETHQQLLITQQTELQTQKTLTGDMHSKLLAHEKKHALHDKELHHQQKRHKSQDVTKSNLRAVLLAVYKGMFQHITIFPGKTLDLEELYVKQEFKLIDHNRKPGEHGKPGEQASVASVADILTKNGKICKNILISAEPGLGKSTFCKHLVRQWCKAHTLKDAKFTEDQKTLQRFELLFYIDLRDATVSPTIPKSDEISELIHEQLDLTDTCSIAEIRNILSGTSALVVMDSLDELGSSRRPKRGIHNNSCIVTTSRPWKIEALRTTLIDVNQHIEIVGLTQTSPKSLANNVLKLLNSGADDSEEKTGKAFITEMVKKKLQHLLNIPLLLIQMLGLWFGGDTFGDTQFQIYSEVIHHQILTAINSKELELPKYDSISYKRNFPCCISCSYQCPCKEYGELLWKIAKMAYHTLFSKEEKMCLVFDHYVTEMYDLSPEEVITCLKIGLLTQHTLFVKNPTKQKKQVNFPHKTNQEYFAAIFLSGEGQQSDLDHIRSVVSDLDRALELDKVLLFCSENNTAVASQLSRLISEIADNNPSIQEYRHSCDISRYDVPHADLIEKIQNIIIPATQQNTELYLSDIIIQDDEDIILEDDYDDYDDDDYDEDEGPQWRRFKRQDRKHFVHYLDLAILKSLRISAHATDELLQSLKLCNHLQKLVLRDSGIKVEDIHEMVVRNTATLITLGLDGEEYGGKPLDILTLGAQWRDMLTVNLSSLGLNNVKLSHEQCQDLSTFVATTNNLRQVKLERISCETHGYYWESGECFMLDFRRNINLHTVKLTYLPVTDFHLQTDSLRSCEIRLPDRGTAQTSILTQLNDASGLQELTCGDINDTTSIFLLLDILPNFNNLQRITLDHVEFGDVHNVCLSATMEKLERVELFMCRITSAGLRCLINSLPKHKVKVTLWFVRVTDDENIFQDIRDSPNTNITRDSGVEKMGDGWLAREFVFDNNSTRPGQA